MRESCLHIEERGCRGFGHDQSCRSGLRAVKQLDAKRLLKPSDELPNNRSRGDVQLLSSKRETLVASRCLDGTQCVEMVGSPHAENIIYTDDQDHPVCRGCLSSAISRFTERALRLRNLFGSQ